MTNIELSIILVSFNSQKYIGACINSITSNVTCSYEVIVIDNNSSDNSIDFLRNEYPDVTVIQSTDNIGFASANNVAAQSALGKFLLLLNVDTELLSDVKSGIEYLREYPNVGLLGARMLGINDEYRYSTGIFPNLFTPFRLSSLYLKTIQLNSHNSVNLEFIELPVRVDWVEGSFMLMERDLWMNLHGMDGNFFMYFEDIDLCKRISDKGLITNYYPEICYRHYGGYSDARRKWLDKSMSYYYNKHFHFYKSMIVKILMTMSTIIRKLIR